MGFFHPTSKRVPGDGIFPCSIKASRRGIASKLAASPSPRLLTAPVATRFGLPVMTKRRVRSRQGNVGCSMIDHLLFASSNGRQCRKHASHRCFGLSGGSSPRHRLPGSIGQSRGHQKPAEDKSSEVFCIACEASDRLRSIKSPERAGRHQGRAPSIPGQQSDGQTSGVNLPLTGSLEMSARQNPV